MSSSGTGVDAELAGLGADGSLWSFADAWACATYGSLRGVTREHRDACEAEWTKLVAKWNVDNNKERGTRLPCTGTATLKYCAMSMLPPSMRACWRDSAFREAFQQLSRNERRAINLLSFFVHEETVPLDDVHTEADLVTLPVHPVVWKKFHAMRYQSACWRYAVILLRRNKGLPELAESAFRGWHDVDY